MQGRPASEAEILPPHVVKAPLRRDIRCAYCGNPTGREDLGGYVMTGDGTPLCHGCWVKIHDMAREALLLD